MPPHILDACPTWPRVRCQACVWTSVCMQLDRACVRVQCLWDTEPGLDILS